MQTLYTYSYNPAVATGPNTLTAWRMAYQQTVNLYRGAPNVVRLVVYAFNQQVVNLTHFDVQLIIIDMASQEQLITKTGVITDPATGVATFTFDADEVTGLDARFYHMVAKLVDPADGSSIAASQILYIDDNYGAFTPVKVEDAFNLYNGS